MKKIVFAAAIGLAAAIGVSGAAIADTNVTVTKKRVVTHSNPQPGIVISDRGVAIGVVDQERCVTKTVKRDNGNREVTRTKKVCR